MTKRLIVAGSVGCLSLLLDQSGHSGVVLIAQSAPARSGAIVQSASPDNLKVVLLGSGMGPRVNLEQFGATTLIEAANLRLLFVCGRGATLRLAQVGVPIGSISRLFLTHQLRSEKRSTFDTSCREYSAASNVGAARQAAAPVGRR